jgi:hypothetical protein
MSAIVGGGVEGAPRWRRSSYSEAGDCVEVAMAGGRILVRDSKVPAGPMLCFTSGEWSAFLAGARDGQFDPR